VIMSL